MQDDEADHVLRLLKESEERLAAGVKATREARLREMQKNKGAE